MALTSLQVCLHIFCDLTQIVRIWFGEICHFCDNAMQGFSHAFLTWFFLGNSSLNFFKNQILTHLRFWFQKNLYGRNENMVIVHNLLLNQPNILSNAGHVLYPLSKYLESCLHPLKLFCEIYPFTIVVDGFILGIPYMSSPFQY